MGKTLVAIVNLPPRKMMGLESNGMLISAVHTEHGEECLHLHHGGRRHPGGREAVLRASRGSRLTPLRHCNSRPCSGRQSRRCLETDSLFPPLAAFRLFPLDLPHHQSADWCVRPGRTGQGIFATYTPRRK